MFLPDDAVREVAPSEYVDRWVSDRLLRRPPERTMTTATSVLRAFASASVPPAEVRDE